MTDTRAVVYPCECDCLKGDHAGGTYACRNCPCRGYRPELWRIQAAGGAVITASGESTSARLRRTEQAGDLLRAELVTARAELARLHGTPVHTYPALYCTRCYQRHDPDGPTADQHGHPLIPVQITVTRREETP